MIILEELKKHERIFSLKDIFLTVSIIGDAKGLTKKELTSILDSSPVQDRYLHSTLLFLESTGVIKQNNSKYRVSEKYRGMVFEKFRENMISESIEILSKELVRNIFHVDYNNGDIYSLNSDIPTEMSVFKNVLIDCGFYSPPILNKLIVNSEYEEFVSEKSGHMTLGNLYKILEREKEIGIIAEIFALEYERNRLSGHPFFSKIRSISLTDVSAGYDLRSFDTMTDVRENRFIEVKGHSGRPSFHWSRNEMTRAKELGPRYHIYLVDVNMCKREGYRPMIITDPYNTLFEDGTWDKSTDSIEFIRIS